MKEKTHTVLNFRSVSKRYGAPVPLDNVSFHLHAGEDCGLLGENGAGKKKLTGNNIEYPLAWVEAKDVKVCKSESFVDGCNTFLADNVPPLFIATSLNGNLLPELSLMSVQDGRLPLALQPRLSRRLPMPTNCLASIAANANRQKIGLSPTRLSR
ncbi:hypothetical protein [Phyllobacterium sp. SB3]|uniref:hypothetical protein n=1 Tax=Phyllobacterium sp. SB3 TaxID=3156073 RepID=UPI0032AF0989